MPSIHPILYHPLLLLPPIPPSIRVFSNESTLCMMWPKYWSFSFSIIPSKEHQDWSPLEWTGCISLKSKGLSRVFFNTTVQKRQFLGIQLSSQSNSHIHTWLLGKPQPWLDRPLSVSQTRIKSSTNGLAPGSLQIGAPWWVKGWLPFWLHPVSQDEGLSAPDPGPKAQAGAPLGTPGEACQQGCWGTSYLRPIKDPVMLTCHSAWAGFSLRGVQS